jgi:PTS system fructose-specific IIC component
MSNDDSIPGEIKHTVSAIVLAGVTIAEIIGPLCTKAAVKNANEHEQDRERLVEFLSEEFVKVDLKADDKWDAIQQLSGFLMRTHRVEHLSEAELYESVCLREKEMSTAIGEGIAIPHGHVDKGPAIQGVMGICPEGIDFNAPDGEPVRLILLIVTPNDKRDVHLKVLASLSRMMANPKIRTRLMAALSPEDAMEVIESEEVRDYNYFLEQANDEGAAR